MIKKFFSFGDKSANSIIKVILITVIAIFSLNFIVSFFPQIYNPFTSYGTIILRSKRIIDFIVNIVYIRVICEIIYLIIRALKVYINKNEDKPKEEN